MTASPGIAVPVDVKTCNGAVWIELEKTWFFNKTILHPCAECNGSGKQSNTVHFSGK